LAVLALVASVYWLRIRAIGNGPHFSGTSPAQVTSASSGTEIATGIKGQEPAKRAVKKRSKSAAENLLGFKRITPKELMEEKSEDLKRDLSNPSDSRFREVGRNDPLTVVDDALPEELRPPRTGDSNDERIRQFLEGKLGTDLINAVNVSVDSAVQIGTVWYVRLTVDGAIFTVRESEMIRASNDAMVIIDSVSDKEVVITISALGVTKRKIFIR
jgi:hypothetical protein